jgi:hypothetical protein
MGFTGMDAAQFQMLGYAAVALGVLSLGLTFAYLYLNRRREA